MEMPKTVVVAAGLHWIGTGRTPLETDWEAAGCSQSACPARSLSFCSAASLHATHRPAASTCPAWTRHELGTAHGGT